MREKHRASPLYDFSEYSSYLTNVSLEYLDLLYLSITTNGSSNEEQTAENPLGVLPYQFEPEFDSNDAENHIRVSFHKAILATIDLSYLRLILRLPALIFTSVSRNKCKTIVNPAHVEKKILFYLTG